MRPTQETAQFNELLQQLDIEAKSLDRTTPFRITDDTVAFVHWNEDYRKYVPGFRRVISLQAGINGYETVADITNLNSEIHVQVRDDTAFWLGSLIEGAKRRVRELPSGRALQVPDEGEPPDLTDLPF